MENEVNVNATEVTEEVSNDQVKRRSKKAYLLGGIAAVGLGLVYAAFRRGKKGNDVVYLERESDDSEFDNTLAEMEEYGVYESEE